MNPETRPTQIDGIQIVRYPMSMTGDKLKKQLGISLDRIYRKNQFKVKHTFKTIKRENRLKFLLNEICKAKRENGEISFLRLNQMRNGFNSHKISQLAMTENTKCYICTEKAVLRHHVVPLFYGGRNKRNNIVPLCNECHCKLHPHMQK